MLNNASLRGIVFGFIASGLLLGCGSGTTTVEDTDPPEPVADSSEPVATDPEEVAATDPEEFGELEIRANGEDFVRQGFVSSDGWQIDFDHVYVTLSEVTAYQSDSAFDPDTEELPQAQTTISTDQPITVDLADGDETADPVLVETLTAPPGRYNALSWQMTPAATGPAAGYPLVIQGQASKAGEAIAFTLKLSPTLEFICGDYVGDDRKGILAANDKADLEATFHFDHLFGDGDAPADDAINQKALGFDPLAAVAEGDTLDVTTEELQSRLAAEDYALIMDILPSLGHVGEGHCREAALADS